MVSGCRLRLVLCVPRRQAEGRRSSVKDGEKNKLRAAGGEWTKASSDHAGKELFESPGQLELSWKTRGTEDSEGHSSQRWRIGNRPSQARPKCAQQSSSFVVLCCVSHFSQHKKHGTQETGPPHHREHQADKKGDLWRKETHLTRVPRLLSEPSPDARLHGLFSAALLCFLV